MRHLKFRNGSAISSGSLAARVDCPNAADVSGLDISASSKVLDSDNADAWSVKSLASRRKTKNDIPVMKEDKVICSSGEKIQPSSNGELVDEINMNLLIHTNVAKEDDTGNVSPIYNQSQSKDPVLLEMVISFSFLHAFLFLLELVLL